MHPDICNVLNNNGFVSCFLTDQQGNTIDPTTPGAILCQEGLTPREDVRVTLPSGDQITLQKINVIKQGYIVIEVENPTVNCLSEPILFQSIETLILCAPEGTELRCNVTDFHCQATANCRDNIFTSLDIFLEICQDIKVVTNTVVEMNASFCAPRERIKPIRCHDPSPNSCSTIFPTNIFGQETTSSLTPHEAKKQHINQDTVPKQLENMCISVPKVYDWITHQQSLQISKTANEIIFNCSPCNLDLFVPSAIICERPLSGKVHCGGIPIENALVSFSASPNIVSFNPNPSSTDANGNFTATATVPEGTPPTSVTITATTSINGQFLSTSLETIVECPADPCTIELFTQDAITCDGFLEGRVFCDDTVIEGALVQLTSSPAILQFDPNPTFTGSNGNYFSGITVVPGTPPQMVTITASTTVNKQTVSASIDVLVDCPSSHCELTLSVLTGIDCEGLITGNISCGGVPVSDAEIVLNGFPDVVTFSPNPATSNSNGDFTATVIVPPGTPFLSVLITATATVNGQTVTTSVGTRVECPAIPCEIDLFIQDTIICNSSIEGSVFCGNTAIEGAVVHLTSNPNILTFDPNPTVTGSHGNYFAGITVPPGTPSQTVTLTASTTVNGQLLSVSTDVLVDCPSPQCTLTLSVPPNINCEGLITGNISCGGVPVAGANISFDASPSVVTFSPNPATSDVNGNFTTTVKVPPGTPFLSVLITASTTVSGQTVTTNAGTHVECQPTPCTIELFSQATITCDGSIEGSVFCGNTAIEGAVVHLTSNPNILTFDPNPTVTGSHGNYFAGITVPPGTPSQTVTLTASTTVNGQLLSVSTDVLVDCPSPQCTLTLSVPPNINCEGLITGNISCGGVPVAGANISFDASPSVVTFSPNPATSDVNGNFTTTVKVPPGTPFLSVLITASTTVSGQTVTTNAGTHVECPPQACPCKFRLGISGNRAPATVNITKGGVSSTLTGTINVSSVQCFIASPGCNPNIDNFNITFGSGGTSINFLQGRRIDILCEDNNFARIHGTAMANGLFNGIFEVTIAVSINPSNIGTWTIFATDNMGDTFATTFTAAMSPTTFIGNCEKTA